jgi:hypothetical protein
MIRKFILGLFVAIFGALSASAHTVWIEIKDGHLVIRFAEPGSDFETSPGYLDSLSLPDAFILVTNSPVSIESSKKNDYFLLTGTAATNVAGLETAFTVRGGRKPYFYARWQPANGGAGIPLLNLDLVPTGKAGEARAYFRGKPLGGVTATLRGPDGNEQEITADSDGFLHYASKQSGLYLLTIAHYREPISGFYNGVAYTETSHNCALTWQKP